MCRPKTKPPACATAFALMLTMTLAGCSGLYTERSDAVVLSAGDAIAANTVQQTYDPWPPRSGNVNYAANGQKMQSAIERYRTDRVIPPINPTTSDVENHAETQAALAAQNSQTNPANAPLPSSITSVGAPGQ